MEEFLLLYRTMYGFFGNYRLYSSETKVRPRNIAALDIPGIPPPLLLLLLSALVLVPPWAIVAAVLMLVLLQLLLPPVVVPQSPVCNGGKGKRPNLNIGMRNGLILTIKIPFFRQESCSNAFLSFSHEKFSPSLKSVFSFFHFRLLFQFSLDFLGGRRRHASQKSDPPFPLLFPNDRLSYYSHFPPPPASLPPNPSLEPLPPPPPSGSSFNRPIKGGRRKRRAE